jgi:phosphate transport system permease protein
MGFAVIPIIYTLADDALSAVPDHLRSASLGCGATLWQTAIWIIIPTALSGVFSAVKIGMGRAVGETMIMVMAREHASHGLERFRRVACLVGKHCSGDA